MTGEIIISIDAMGGDNAPAIVFEGMERTAIRHPRISFLAFGDEAALAPLLADRSVLQGRVTIRHCEDVVAMDAKPGQAVRRGKKTSMWHAIAAVKAGEAAVAVSAGNTGALMGMALLQLRPMAGVKRPALIAPLPTVHGECVVLDLGANITADADDLADYAVMGAAFARVSLGHPRPTVGLLNVGTEDVKGHDAVRQAADKIAASLEGHRNLPMEFVGFVEGDGISAGAADVIVTDGFTGNIALKTAEGTAKLIREYLSEAFRSSLLSKIGYVFAQGAFKVLRNRLNPNAHNGGVFLGLNGLVVKSHGGADGLGYATALDTAANMAENDLVARIARDLVEFGHEPPP